MEITRDQYIKELERELKERFCHYKPYDKQKAFHNAGHSVRERVLSAGNQLGKTYANCAETAFHLTGEYPDWWQGKRFDKPVHGWMGGVTGESVRDTIQLKMFGDIDRNYDGGFMPASRIISHTNSRGIAKSIDTIKIKHISGGTSTLAFKSYEKGREKWQGPSLDFVSFDEEPPADIYIEGLSRTNATNGIVFMTFTPLKGMSNVVMMFWKGDSAGRSLTMLGIKDALHISEKQREVIIASYQPHERKARVEGIPTLGSGRIFPLSREDVSAVVPDIPNWWPRAAGLDFGWDHPTAAVWGAYDRDTDTIWIYDCYRKSERTVAENSAVIRQRGDWIPVAWPHDGLQHDKGSGVQLAQQYRDNGVNLLGARATFPDGTNGLEAGLFEMLDRLKSGRMRVAPHLEEWFEEFDLYHRKDGKVVAIRDDLMCATRYLMMMIRFAEVEPNDYYEDDYRHEDVDDVCGY